MRQIAMETLDSGRWVKGPQGRAFADEFANYCGVAYASPCNSGSGALIVALRLLGIGPGDEVIVPSLTFIATATSVSMTGATPVFAEVEPDFWCLNVEDVKKRITSKTKGVIGVHLFGQCYIVSIFVMILFSLRAKVNSSNEEPSNWLLLKLSEVSVLFSLRVDEIFFKQFLPSFW